MNWDAIKHIYRNVLIDRTKIKYFGKDKYILTRYYSSGKKREQIEYKNNKAHGKSFGWFEDGSKEWEIEYKYSELHGRYRVWFEDGSINHDCKYKDGYEKYERNYVKAKTI